MEEKINELKEAEKEQTEAEWNQVDTRAAHRPARRHGPNWGAGLALIIIGLIFLVANTTDFYLNNWWALFILIPAVSNFGNAWRDYEKNGRLTHAGRGSITGGLILTLIASAFLFSLDWGLIWPVFLIIGGLAALLGGWFD